MLDTTGMVNGLERLVVVVVVLMTGFVVVIPIGSGIESDIPLSDVDTPNVVVFESVIVVVSIESVALTGTALFLICLGNGAYLGYSCSASTKASKEVNPAAIASILTMVAGGFPKLSWIL